MRRLKRWGRLAVVPALGAALALALALPLAGCHKAVNTLGPADPQAVPDVQEHKKVIFHGKLNKRARVENIYVDNRSGLLTVQANVRNLKKSNMEFMYKFDWFDERGMEIYDPANPWTRKEIFGGEFISLQGVAPSPKAVDWRLSMKAVKD
ncbi:MAG: hypothetical protein Kow0059_15640 [Candidatus Sumerlaeia bacterium]